MDPDQSSRSGRKVRFTPKAPPKRKPKPPAATKTEQVDEHNEDTAEGQALLRRFNESLARRQPKERKSKVEVAFGPGGSSPSLRTYGTSRGVDSGTDSGSASKLSAKEQIGFRRSLGATTEDQNDTFMIDVTDDIANAAASKIKREYVEPWDFNSNYPITLPLRKPYSGDPEILDEEEFGEAATNAEYDEKTVNPAEELGLLEKKEEHPRMLLFQFPPTLPFAKQPVSNKGKEKIGTSSSVSKENTKSKGIALEELPKGYMGKLLVYKSGAIKLNLGETLFDVSPGTNCICAQNIVAVNTAEKHCCDLGEVSKRVVLSPDVDSIEL
ncbi:hypothetical protein RJT34_31455 [Clitoria ternatea]|uniref:Uncharacterized protein n=1 Tax=Clitoria ternatea TaxID=43366 RepID=A0AAN9I1D2_CLITE